MKNKILSTLLVILMVCTVSTQASKVKQTSAEPKLDCPDVKLLRHATKEERRISTDPNEEPFFLSEHYCFVYAKRMRVYDANLPVTYSGSETIDIINNYSMVFRQLLDDEQKLTFIHLFIATFSQRAFIFPDSDRSNLVSISVSTKVRGTGFWFNLIIDEDPRLMLDRLGDIQSNPPKETDHPILMALVLQVLDVSTLLSAESVQDQLLALK
jgi:hypothetical protein